METRVDMNQQYRECPGDLTTALREGASMQGVVASLAEGLGDRISLDTRVTRIISLEDGMVVVAGERQFPCRYVILTVSLGVLKAEAATMFHPPLPADKLETIASLGFGVVDKVFLEFTLEVREGVE